MLSSLKNLQRIVTEMEKTIGHNINIMDNRGIIVANTDRQRIGQFHEGAANILRQQLDELVVADPEPEGEDAGMREGINLPIVIEGEIVGVVGITGDPGKVEVFGKVIQKMTQVLVADTLQKEKHQLYDQTRRSFVYRWLLETPLEDERTFAMRGNLLGIDVSLPRIAVVVDPGAVYGGVEDSEELRGQMLHERMVSWLQREFRYDPQTLVVSVGAKCTVLLHGESTQECRQTFEGLLSRMLKELPCRAACCMGGVSRNLLEMQRSFREAEQACRVSLANPDHPVYLFEQLDIELLLQEVSYKSRQRFVRRVLRDCPPDETAEWVHLLRVYFQHNCSIGRAADSLYIHKNTMQYRLQKIKQLTGYDPRVMTEAVPLYLAAQLYDGDFDIG